MNGIASASEDLPLVSLPWQRRAPLPARHRMGGHRHERPRAPLVYQISLPPRVLDRFLFEFALVPSRFFGQLSLVAPSDWTPFLTNIFLHGGWLHLILNMWTLWCRFPSNYANRPSIISVSCRST